MPRIDPARRAVITGIGLITPLASSQDLFWQALAAGQSGIRRIRFFDPSPLPCQIAGEIPDFDPLSWMPAKEARRMSRASQLALASAVQAVGDAGLPLPLPNPERAGVYIGTAFGGSDRMVEAMHTYETEGLSRVNPFLVPASLPNMVAFHITARVGALGPSMTITTACAAGTQAVGEAAAIIRHGQADLMLAGGADALVSEFAVAAFSVMRALPTNYNDRPESASRPFDAKREGFVLSEAAACLVLESLEHARARNAHIYAEVTGYASSNDGFHVAALDPAGAGPARTMAWALQNAGIAPEQIDYINAHGSSTPVNDAAETVAIKKIFGVRAPSIPVSSTKSMVGHSMGAAGAIEAAVCALTIRHQTIHPTINYEFPDPECDLDYVPNHSRPAKVEVALSNSFGLGSQSACLVVTRLED